MKDKYFVLSLGVGFSLRSQQVMRAFGRDVSIYKEKVVRTQVPDDKRASNHENIYKNYNKIGSKFLLLRGRYPLSFNLLEIGESQTFAKLGVKRAGPLRFSPGMNVVFLLLLALALTPDAGWVTSRDCKTVGFVFPKNHFINKAEAKCEGRKKFSSRLSPVSPRGVTPIRKGRDGSARLVSGVHAREQRAAKPLDARNEGTRVVICVSRALCSIEPSACRLLERGKNWRAKRAGESLGREIFFAVSPRFSLFPNCEAWSPG